jgi:hypothetical protein
MDSISGGAGSGGLSQPIKNKAAISNTPRGLSMANEAAEKVASQKSDVTRCEESLATATI